MTEQTSGDNAGLEVGCYFVRSRNALLVRAEFEPLYIDHYLHLVDRGVQYTREQDAYLKDALAAMVLHCASRPRNECTAWTIHLQSPLLNVFVTGDNPPGTVVGQLFDEDIRESSQNLFYSKVVRSGGAIRTSAVSFTQNNIFRAVEHYYHQSEQRPARYFSLGDEDFAMLSAQPDCDLTWFEGLQTDELNNMEDQEEISLLEKRFYRWYCGCNQEKIFQLLSAPMKENPEALFEGEASLRICCPRCGIKYLVTRESLEAYIQKGKK